MRAASCNAEPGILEATCLPQILLNLGILAALRELGDLHLVVASTAYVVGRSFVVYFGERARAKSHIALYTVAQTGSALAGGVLGFLLIVFVSPTAAFVMTGFAIAHLLVGLWLLRRFGSGRFERKIDRDLLRKALAFGLPLVVANVINWVNLNGIRVVMEAMGGATAVGLLAVGWGLGQRLATTAAMFVTMAAFPLAARSLEQGARSTALRQMEHGGTLLVGAVLPASVGLCMITRPFVDLLISATVPRDHHRHHAGCCDDRRDPQHPRPLCGHGLHPVRADAPDRARQRHRGHPHVRALRVGYRMGGIPGSVVWRVRRVVPGRLGRLRHRMALRPADAIARLGAHRHRGGSDGPRSFATPGGGGAAARRRPDGHQNRPRHRRLCRGDRRVLPGAGETGRAGSAAAARGRRAGRFEASVRNDANRLKEQEFLSQSSIVFFPVGGLPPAGADHAGMDSGRQSRRAQSRTVPQSRTGARGRWCGTARRGRFEWHYDIDETVHFVEGSVTISSEGMAPRRFGPGDVIFFPAGSKATWEVHSYIRKVAFCRKVLPAPLVLCQKIYQRVRRLVGGRSGNVGALTPTA